jgi:hypothetical protein
MSSRPPLSGVGLRLPRSAIRVLKDHGIFAQSSVSLEHQHLAKRYIIRGVESGGAAGDVGHYVTFAHEDGQSFDCFCPVETIGLNGPHAVVLAPVLVRIEMLRKSSTYQLLITQHRLSSASNGRRPQLESKMLFRGVHGRLESGGPEKNDAHAGTALPGFYSRSGEQVEIPKCFRSAVRALTAAVQCQGCTHSHYTKVSQATAAVAVATSQPARAALADAVPEVPISPLRIETTSEGHDLELKAREMASALSVGSTRGVKRCGTN